ncbi:multidrug efflux MFS transporter [Paenibacillus sp. IB182496]|uniref:Multidrug efflux MFS transporter n=1 Tax=Paenibacillus sabuli TaxID=2772509 RepID=A0A927GPX6_9BACL|nr:MDR family MFS transporter [Paenibacillus sabuli]MBD2843783.1 multidrug efflux MFS transporter [Paenibacillus sabuli]
MAENVAISSTQKRWIVAVLLIGAFIAILNQTLLATALPPIMADLGIGPSQGQWLTTVFMLMNGIMIPITAFLIEKFTTRRLFLTAMTLFAIGSLIAAVSHTFGLLMVGRIVQATAAGIMMPLMQTTMFLIFPPERRGTAMGMVGLVISFAPAIGPSLSGWIVDSHSWRLLFYVVIPIALIDIVLAARYMSNVTKLSNPKVDVPSILLSSLGFGGLLYGFSSAGHLSWTHVEVWGSLAVGAVTLVLFIRRQLRMSHPMLEFRVFKNPTFRLTTGIGMIVFTSMIGAQLLLPLYVQDMRGFSALESGLLLLPGAIVMGIMSPITGRIFDKVGGKGLAVVGLALLSGGTFPFMMLDEHTSLTVIAALYAVRMLGVSMVLMPLTTAGLNQLSRELLPHGTAMNNTMRQVAGSIGTALLITVMSRAGSAAGAGISGSIHGVNVAFGVAAWIAVLGFALAWFIRKPRAAAEHT